MAEEQESPVPRFVARVKFSSTDEARLRKFLRGVRMMADALDIDSESAGVDHPGEVLEVSRWGASLLKSPGDF